MLVLLAVHLAFTQRGEADFEGNDTGGEEINPRIINGDDADENEYPFMVSQVTGHLSERTFVRTDICPNC